VNIRYFTGFQSLHWTAMSIQTGRGSPALEKDRSSCPDFFSQVAEGYTYIKDIRLIAKPHVTSNISRSLSTLPIRSRTLAAAGLESGSRRIAGWHVRASSDYDMKIPRGSRRCHPCGGVRSHLEVPHDQVSQ